MNVIVDGTCERCGARGVDGRHRCRPRRWDEVLEGVLGLALMGVALGLWVGIVAVAAYTVGLSCAASP